MQDDKVQIWGDRLDFSSSTEEKLKGLDSEGAAPRQEYYSERLGHSVYFWIRLYFLI